MSYGLVLEGGGMRGVYTSGVLEYFMERGLRVPYIVGVSAGACNACSYISSQPGRNKKVTIGFSADPRYLSVRNLLREGSMFGMRFMFEEIPQRLVPFDFDTFYGSGQRFVVGATDAETGKAVYFEKRAGENFLAVVQASSSLPFVSRPVILGGRVLFDGGITDPIPLRKSIADGNQKHIVVLTKPAGYRKSPFTMKRFARMFYPKYPGLVQALLDRYRIYNETLEEIERGETEGTVFALRPSVAMDIGRMEKNPQRLTALYELGLRDAEREFGRMERWLQQA